MSNNAFAACSPGRSVPVMQIHGTSDLIVSYNGSVAGGKSVDDVVGLWVANNGCTVTPSVQLLPDVNTQDNSTVEKSTFAPCNAGVEVVLLKVIGGGHQWPGTTALLGGLGAINRDINASGEIWNFFRNYSCAVTAGLGDQMNGEAQQFTWLKDPYSGAVTVSYAGQGSFEVELFDLTGKSILQQEAFESLVLNPLGLNAGVYLLKAVAGQSVRVFKIQL
jgi:polyhydroxybutyrate depolymerase